MSKQDIRNLVNDILDDEKKVEGITIYEVLPFMCKEDVDTLFDQVIESKETKVNFVAIAPFVSSSKLSMIVDKYVNGELEDLDINLIYPFLSSADIKRVFDYLVRKKRKISKIKRNYKEYSFKEKSL